MAAPAPLVDALRAAVSACASPGPWDAASLARAGALAGAALDAVAAEVGAHDPASRVLPLALREVALAVLTCLAIVFGLRSGRLPKSCV